MWARMQSKLGAPCGVDLSARGDRAGQRPAAHRLEAQRGAHLIGARRARHVTRRVGAVAVVVHHRRENRDTHEFPTRLLCMSRFRPWTSAFTRPGPGCAPRDRAAAIGYTARATGTRRAECAVEEGDEACAACGAGPGSRSEEHTS